MPTSVDIDLSDVGPLDVTVDNCGRLARVHIGPLHLTVDSAEFQRVIRHLADNTSGRAGGGGEPRPKVVAASTIRTGTVVERCGVPRTVQSTSRYTDEYGAWVELGFDVPDLAPWKVPAASAITVLSARPGPAIPPDVDGEPMLRGEFVRRLTSVTGNLGAGAEES